MSILRLFEIIKNIAGELYQMKILHRHDKFLPHHDHEKMSQKLCYWLTAIGKLPTN